LARIAGEAKIERWAFLPGQTVRGEVSNDGTEEDEGLGGIMNE
jgi:hypothetical protein